MSSQPVIYFRISTKYNKELELQQKKQNTYNENKTNNNNNNNNNSVTYRKQDCVW
jgi:hypothetical protein